MDSFNVDGSSPDVTIYIASINTAFATELCIRSITRFTRRSDYQLTVGDCGSTDDSLARLMKLLRLGLIDDVEVAAHGRSHGAWLDLWTESCPTRFAVMVDSDVEILEPGWLDVLTGTARESGAAIVCAEIVAEVPGYVDYTGVPRRLARRPSAWMMLLDVSKCRGKGSWQFAMQHDASIPEQQWGLDTGALLMRQLLDSGEQVLTASADFQKRFRHFGGLSWVKVTPSKGWRNRASLLKVRLLNLYVFLRLIRVKWTSTSG